MARRPHSLAAVGRRDDCVGWGAGAGTARSVLHGAATGKEARLCRAHFVNKRCLHPVPLRGGGYGPSHWPPGPRSGLPKRAPPGMLLTSWLDGLVPATAAPGSWSPRYVYSRAVRHPVMGRRHLGNPRGPAGSSPLPPTAQRVRGCLGADFPHRAPDKDLCPDTACRQGARALGKPRARPAHSQRDL